MTNEDANDVIEAVREMVKKGYFKIQRGFCFFGIWEIYLFDLNSPLLNMRI